MDCAARNPGSGSAEDPAVLGAGDVELFEIGSYSPRTVRAHELIRWMPIARRRDQASISRLFCALNMFADIRRSTDLRARAAQLLQRSNQFNLTTIRHSEAELKAIAAALTATRLPFGCMPGDNHRGCRDCACAGESLQTAGS